MDKDIDKLVNLMVFAKRLVSMNNSILVDYDDYSVNTLLDFIYAYRVLKKRHKAIIIAQTMSNYMVPLTNIHYARSGENKGQFYIRSLYCNDPSDISDDAWEYDNFLLNYIYEKFNIPVSLLKSYMKIRNFEI